MARGRAAILQRLRSSAELHGAYGHGAHEVDAIDPQPLEVRRAAMHLPCRIQLEN